MIFYWALKGKLLFIYGGKLILYAVMKYRKLQHKYHYSP